MDWITIEQLRSRCPVEAEGVEDDEIEEAIGSAIEELTGLAGPESKDSMLIQSAVAKYAHADVLDIILARDGRGDEDEALLLRKTGERQLLSYLEARQSDDDPSTADVPPIIVTSSGPQILNFPDERY